METCLVCDAPQQYSGFNLEFAAGGKDAVLSRLIEHIEFDRRLKFGSLYRCPNSRYWFLDDFEVWMERVDPSTESLLFLWDQRELVVSADIANAMEEIGGIEGDQFGNGNDEIRIPCSARSRGGEEIDPGLLLITRHPPIRPSQKVLLGDSIDAVTQSDFALPWEVRNACLGAPEVRMGLAPTIVQSPSGALFALNWSPSFFLHDVIRGRDITLAAGKRYVEGTMPIVGEQPHRLTYIYFDWYDGCTRLIRMNSRGDR